MRRLALLGVVIVTACSDGPPTLPHVSAAAGGNGSPVVAATDPNNAPQDTTLDVVVSGSGFDQGSQAQWATAGVPAAKVRTNSTRFVNPRELVVNITIEFDADTVLYDVIVTTTTGKKGIGTELFRVRAKGPKPEEPADPEIAYVGDDALMVMNASGSNQMAVFTGTVDPAWPAWAPGGGAIAFDYEGAYHLWRVDVGVVGGVPTGTNATVLVDTTTGFPDWSPDGATIAVQGAAAGRPGENCCLLTLPATGGPAAVAYMAPVGRSVMFAAWSPGGDEIAFLERDRSCASSACNAEIRILTLATGATRVVVPGGRFYGFSMDLEWSPQGSEIAFVARTKRVGYELLHVVNVAGGAITALGIEARSPSFSPAGNRIVYESLKASGIYVLDRATGVTTQLTSAGRMPDWRK